MKEECTENIFRLFTVLKCRLMFQTFCFYDKFTAFSTSRGILPGTFLFFTEVILMPDQKEYYMRRALALAARGAGHVDPNPCLLYTSRCV